MQTWETNPYSSYCNYLIAVYTIPQSVFWGGPEKINPAVFSKIKISKNEFESGFFLYQLLRLLLQLVLNKLNSKELENIQYKEFTVIIYFSSFVGMTVHSELKQDIDMKPSIGNWI